MVKKLPNSGQKPMAEAGEFENFILQIWEFKVS
jgi:hypothetical protein